MVDTARKSNVPMVNIPLLRRDAYFLLALLFADEKFDRPGELSDTAAVYFETEVNRLLIWLATASRQMLEASGSAIEGKECGEYSSLNKGKIGSLSFKKACHIIIHATEIVPYEVLNDEYKGKPTIHIPLNMGQERGYYKGALTVRGKKENRGAEVMQLQAKEFVECVILLSKEIENRAHHAD